MEKSFQLRLVFDGFLIFILITALAINFTKIAPLPETVFVVLAIIGLLPVLRSAIVSLRNRELSIDLLASVALIFAMLAGEWHSAAFINLMLTFARLFDTWTEMRTKNIISSLLKYRPEKIKIKIGEEIKEVTVEQVKVNDLVVVEAGERIPVDGVVENGQASIDESVLTGESEAVTKKPKDKVFSSTLNVSGSLLVKAEKVGADTTLERMIVLVEEATRKKSKVEKLASKFTGWYILLTLVGSAVLLAFIHNPSIVLAVLLVVCADDIAVAVPLSFTSAIAHGAKRGILIKGSDVMETLPKIRYFLTDKTGTMTRGKPRVVEMKFFSKLKKEKLLEYFGAAAINSTHPIDETILNFVQNQKIEVPASTQFHETPGEGISAVHEKKQLLVGRIAFLESNGVKLTQEEKTDLETTKNKGYGITALAVNKKLAAAAVLEDEIRPFARELIIITKKLGVLEWFMLTGDNEVVASKVSSQLGIDEFKAGLKPEEKLKEIETFKSHHEGTLAMIGDGVNDAASLAMADVSFSMGAIGSDAAIEASDVALMNDKLERIPEAIILARKTQTIIKQCFFIWGVTNGLGLALVFLRVIDAQGAAAYNFLTDFIPIFNALRINYLSLNPLKGDTKN